MCFFSVRKEKITVKYSKTITSAELRMTVQKFVETQLVYIPWRKIFAYTNDRSLIQILPLQHLFIFFFLIAYEIEYFSSLACTTRFFCKVSLIRHKCKQGKSHLLLSLNNYQKYARI